MSTDLMSKRKEWLSIRQSDRSVDNTSITTAPEYGSPLVTSIEDLFAMQGDFDGRPNPEFYYAADHEVFGLINSEGKAQDLRTTRPMVWFSTGFNGLEVPYGTIFSNK